MTGSLEPFHRSPRNGHEGRRKPSAGYGLRQCEHRPDKARRRCAYGQVTWSPCVCGGDAADTWGLGFLVGLVRLCPHTVTGVGLSTHLWGQGLPALRWDHGIQEALEYQGGRWSLGVLGVLGAQLDQADQWSLVLEASSGVQLTVQFALLENKAQHLCQNYENILT